MIEPIRPLDAPLFGWYAPQPSVPSVQSKAYPLREHVVTPTSLYTKVRDCIALTKPRITLLVVITTAAGMRLAPGSVTPTALLYALVGTVLIVGAANALNMWWERDTDALMSRTAKRPLPAGRMAPAVALVIGTGLASVAVPLLLRVNLVTGLLGLLAFLTYVFLYTPLKRRTSHAILVGAVPGALPPLMGWTAVTGTIDWGGIALFLVLFVWQIPHFAAITLFRGEEYARAGLRVISVERGEAAAKRAIFGYSVACLLVTLLPYHLALSGRIYLLVALLTGAGFVGLAIAAARSTGQRSLESWGRRIFGASILYLVVLLATALLDRVVA